MMMMVVMVSMMMELCTRRGKRLPFWLCHIWHKAAISQIPGCQTSRRVFCRRISQCWVSNSQPFRFFATSHRVLPSICSKTIHSQAFEMNCLSLLNSLLFQFCYFLGCLLWEAFELRTEKNWRWPSPNLAFLSTSLLIGCTRRRGDFKLSHSVTIFCHLSAASVSRQPRPICSRQTGSSRVHGHVSLSLGVVSVGVGTFSALCEVYLLWDVGYCSVRHTRNLN